MITASNLWDKLKYYAAMRYANIHAPGGAVDTLKSRRENRQFDDLMREALRQGCQTRAVRREMRDGGFAWVSQVCIAGGWLGVECFEDWQATDAIAWFDQYR